MNKRRKTVGRWLMGVGLLLLAAAAALTAYNVWDTRRAAETADQVLEQLVSAIPSPLPVQTPPAGEVLPMPEPEEEIPDYILAPKMEMPVQKVDGNGYIGVLEIPSLNLSLPVMSEWSYGNLKVTPCRYSGSVYTDDMVIAAHNYKGHFGALPRLLVDSEILFTDVDGNVFRYRVAGLETLSATAVEEMTSGEWDLTLFTCTMSRQSRLTVRAERIKESQ